MKNTYVTYFDLNYSARGLALIQSLRNAGDHKNVVVLALDNETKKLMLELDLPNSLVIDTQSLIDAYPELAQVRKDRSPMEFTFTLTPWLSKWVMENSGLTQPDDDNLWVTYLDADTYFFDSPGLIMEEQKEHSVGIVEHRFSPDQAWRNKFGIYNVGWVSFRNDENGKACLNWWAEQCLDWCSDEIDGEKYADQGYLNWFPKQFDGVKIIANPGVNLAPWNLKTHELSLSSQNHVLVDGSPLVLFHFHGIRKRWDRFLLKHYPYRVKTTEIMRSNIYKPYFRVLSKQITRETEQPRLRRKITRAPTLSQGRTFILDALALLRGDTLKMKDSDSHHGGTK